MADRLRDGDPELSVLNRRFNLLPHRQMARDVAFRILCRQLVAISMLAVVCAWAGHRYLTLQLDEATAFSATLHEAIGELIPQGQQAVQLQQRYAHLLQRQTLIESLDARRSTSVLLLADVAEALPQEVYLTRFEENGEQVVIVGRSVDSAGIARFMERLSQSAYLTVVTLSEIRSLDQGSNLAIATPFQFSIAGRVLLVKPLAVSAPSANETP